MNLQHLRAFLWLRWRLRRNQWRRSGTLNAILMAIIAGAGVLLALILFVVGLLVGRFPLATASPPVVLFVWDGVVIAFLFFWAAGLLTDLQRTEILSLDKFLHLPVSLTGAFLINYLSSLFNLALVLFVPPMLGLSLGLVLGRGPVMLLLLPLVAAFLLMITALTYQFQGWLAALMTNPRRRRTVIVVLTAVFVLIVNLPNLLNLYFQPLTKHPPEARQHHDEEKRELEEAYRTHKIPADQYHQQKEQLAEEHRRQVEHETHATVQQAEQTARLASLALPPGWLAVGAEGAAEAQVLPGLLATVGMTLIGAASLWRAYRTTLRLYTGQFTSPKRQPVVATPPAPVGKEARNLLEREIPGLSGQAAVIALAGFRSLLRAPEAKMMLLGPIILVVVFGSMFLTRSLNPPEGLRPLIGLGAVAMVLATFVQVAGNQFGFDRSGFRVFVLSGVPRREILLGKNLALAPLALGLALAVIVLIQVVYPVRLEFFVAEVPQLLSMYLVYCVLTNWLSIFAPIAIAPGALKPANPKLIPVLLHLVFFFLFPLSLAPILAPLGIAVGLEALRWSAGIPVCLILSLIECAGVAFLYRLLLTGQGYLLHSREQQILTTVTSKGE